MSEDIEQPAPAVEGIKPMESGTAVPADPFMMKDGATGRWCAVREATDEHLQKQGQDLFAQYNGYRKQAEEMLSKGENALSGANMVAYELNRRRFVQAQKEAAEKANGAAPA